MARAPVLTPQAQDFPRWYQDVVAKAELAENGPVRGTMILRPYGYSLWERVQLELDARIKAAGAENAYFPLLIPMSYLDRESDHVEGFRPELAVVTHAGGKELDEPIVVRPTSETIIGESMSRWIQSYRDLPLLLNAWNNVVRWELRPRLLLRTTEFLWQEGHTAHATEAEAHAYAVGILHDAYEDLMVNVLALPVVVGRKPPGERFPGAVNSMTCEAMMRDGKALQMGTSHELGQNFARMFDISFSDATGAQEHCWTSSWGVSTRTIGGLIMAHGDDSGLRVPPRLAPIQVVVLQIGEGREVSEAATGLSDALVRAGIRVRRDDRVDVSFGRRATEWALKGVPVRVEIGPRDVSEGQVTIVRRDNGDKRPMAIGEVPTRVAGLLEEIQAGLLEEATRRRDQRTADVESVADARDAAASGFARIPWSLLAGGGEADLAASAVTVRCLQRPDTTMPDDDDEPGSVAVVGRSY